MHGYVVTYVNLDDPVLTSTKRVAALESRFRHAIELAPEVITSFKLYTVYNWCTERQLLSDTEL